MRWGINDVRIRVKSVEGGEIGEGSWRVGRGGSKITFWNIVGVRKTDMDFRKGLKELDIIFLC